MSTAAPAHTYALAAGAKAAFAPVTFIASVNVLTTVASFSSALASDATSYAFPASSR